MDNPRPYVCLLEDDDAVRESLGWMLERNGFAVRTFQSPRDFLQSAGLDRYDCLSVDIGLPGMNGLELLELLRARAFAKPAILLAAAGYPLLEEHMHAAGAIELLLKPIEPETLLLALRKAIRHRNEVALRT